MKFRLYKYPRCEKVVKSIGGLTKYINTSKILIFLLCYKLSNFELVLDYNLTISLNLPSDNNKNNIRSIVSNNDNKKIRPAEIDINKKEIRPADMNKQKPAISN